MYLFIEKAIREQSRSETESINGSKIYDAVESQFRKVFSESSLVHKVRRV